MANIARTFDDLAALAPESPTELIELVHDFIQSIRPDGSFLSMNRACREALGYSSEEFRRLSILDIIHPLGRSFCEESFRYVLAGGTLDRIATRSWLDLHSATPLGNC